MGIHALPVDQRIIDIDSRRFASIEKALVELITNSDDSYARLEQRGIPVSGLITVSYERHLTGAVLTVADQSEGMSLDRLRSVLSYGGAHSLLSHGQAAGRGYFGRGLKQAVYGLGHGWVESIHHGRFARVDLFRTEEGAYVFDDWDADREVKDRDRTRLGVPADGEGDIGEGSTGEPTRGNGTLVTIVVESPDVVLPYFRTLLAALGHNVYLRDVLRRRRVELVNRHGTHATAPLRLTYEEPASDLLVGPEDLRSFTYAGTTYVYTLTLRRAVASELILKGDERTNGLLVLSGTAVLDCQFFRFENQLGTEYLFGTVSCPGLAMMLAQGHPVISDEREGLNPKEPFVAAFAAAVSDAIAPSVQSERLRLSHVDHASTTRRTAGLIEEVLSTMNRAAVDDLGIVLPPGPGSGTYGPFPTGRPAVLRFSTPFYYRTVGHPFHVTLVVDRDQVLDQDLLEFTYDVPATIEVTPAPTAMPVADLLPDGHFTWTVLGEEIGADGRLTVTCGPWRATCEVVIAERGSGHGLGRGPSRTDGSRRGSWDQDNSTDMFIGYELRNLTNDIDRAVYSPEERLVLINTEAPTVRMYIDGRGHFRDGARLLLAELLLDVIAGELARRYVDRTQQKGSARAYNQAKHTFVRRYGLDIHRIMGGE
ncbi:Histidine kinase-, DNA gyrase B-, and HSP90-like ATPase [Raineyella antarctica]|uniref:Histidine kinase-, DNA gyrase B-, and HSP90-like ATPase n=1 Tax=Raineyella antarctica TaxID=1577474 RepID=A0A1G6I1G0_9ACTN|nr:ATP-binding protein [Raineyella antarctica]SDC00238.1 Histidine kinase-, DNA gyrase B-, and HSP90-like ATPase [Raineyella antarctica]